MIHKNRFRSVNASRIKQLRLARNWSQEELGRRAGYSERLIRKAEAGGNLSVETISDLAEALSAAGDLVTPQSLECDFLGMAKKVLESYDYHGVSMPPLVRDLLVNNFIWYCPGDPTITPFAGTWYEADGLISRIDDEYDTKAAADSHSAAMP